MHLIQRVFSSTTDLGYSLAEICHCLQGLREEDYRESIDYNNGQGWLDVYRCNWPAPTPHAYAGELDSLYIKLKLNRDCNTIFLISFHLDR